MADDFYTFDNMNQYDDMNMGGFEAEPISMVTEQPSPDLKQQVMNLQDEVRLMKTMMRRLEREIMALSQQKKSEGSNS